MPVIQFSILWLVHAIHTDFRLINYNTDVLWNPSKITTITAKFNVFVLNAWVYVFSMYLIFILNWNKMNACIFYSSQFLFYLEAFSLKSIQNRASTKTSKSKSKDQLQLYPLFLSPESSSWISARRFLLIYECHKIIHCDSVAYQVHQNIIYISMAFFYSLKTIKLINLKDKSFCIVSR